MPTIKRTNGAIAAIVLVAAGNAYAEGELTDPPSSEQCPEPSDCPPEPTTQPTTQYTPPPPPPAPAPVVEEVEAPWYDRVGWGLSVGGGVDAFAGGAADDVTSVGGGWNARLTMGTREYIAGELSYFGSAQSFTDTGAFNSSADLIGNGLQLGVRVNMMKNYVVQPFAYSGAAWRHYDITDNDIPLSDVNDSADVFELPLGIGLAGYYQGFMADMRAEYRWGWGDELVVFSEDSGMDRWNITANVGAEF